MTRLTLAAATLLLALPSLAVAQDTFKIDPAHTSVYFHIGHLDIAEVYGRFNDMSGSYDEADGELQSFEFELKTASVDTGNEKRDDHLRSSDFFDADQHPTITLASTSIEPTEDSTYEVEAELTLHGTTKTVRFELLRNGETEDPWGNFRSGYSTSFTIDRMDYGVEGSPDMVGSEVKLMISFEGIRQ